MSGLQALSRKERERVARQLEKINAKYPEHLIDVPKESWPPTAAFKQAAMPFRVMRSRDYMVQLFLEVDQIVRMSVIRTEITTSGKWKENISWEDLQSLKAQAGYAAREAIEIFPSAGNEVNVANMRHLWVLPYAIPFAWGPNSD